MPDTAKPKPEKRPFFTDEDKDNLKWFWENYFRKNTPWLFVVFALILVQAFAYQQFLSLTENGLRVIFDEGQVRDLMRVCAIVFGLFFLRAIISYVIPRLSIWLVSAAVMEMRQHLISHVMTLDLSFFERNSPGDIILRLANQTQAVSSFVGQATINAIRDLVTVVVVAGYLLWKNPILFGSVIFIAPVILFVLRVASRKVKEVQAKSESAMGAYMNGIEETVNGMRTVKISNQERFEERRLMQATKTIRNLMRNIQAAQAVVLPSIDVASAFAYSLVIGLGGFMVLSPSYDIDGAEILTFMLGMVLVFDPLRNFSKFFTKLQANLIILKSVRNLLHIQPEITDAEGAVSQFDTHGDIDFKDVWFSYAPGKPLFKGINLTFEGGKSTAIVGATGSGKTTVLSLLSRLYEVKAGEITVGGTPIRDIKVNALRRSFSVVAQDIVIFNASIWENIQYVRPEASDEEVWAAAEAAEIADVMRDRGDAPLGPKGAKLSGGQKQRIAIARAFLRDAPILLLDEATSALDQRTEDRVKLALARLSHNRTTIVIAHRLSAITDVDKIYVLEQGKLAEQGTHEDLLAQGGLYAGMYGAQRDGYDRPGGSDADGATAATG
ncbi:MAG: ABC transporter ATP-binding protein [Pseudomonadota bacterium]